MLSGAITNRYTQGLYGTASQHGLVEKVDESLKILADGLAAHAELRTLLEHPLIPADRKVKVVTDVFGDAIDPIVVRFVSILFARGRSAYVGAIYNKFHALAEAGRGQATVLVEAAQPLSDSQVKHIEATLSGVLNKQAQAVVYVNKDLIAGYRARLGNRVVEATVKGALEQFGQKLMLSGTSREGTH